MPIGPRAANGAEGGGANNPETWAGWIAGRDPVNVLTCCLVYEGVVTWWQVNIESITTEKESYTHIFYFNDFLIDGIRNKVFTIFTIRKEKVSEINLQGLVR